MSEDTGVPRKRRWFLPDTPDVLGMLRAQGDVTAEGLAAFALWAQGDADRAEEVRESEHLADDARRTLVAAIRDAFTTPLASEDLFELSQDLDRVMNGAKNTVREAEAMALPPDQPIAEMAALLAEGVGHLRTAFQTIGKDGDASTSAADEAVKSQRRLERVYRHAMNVLTTETDLRLVIGRQELYRRVSAMSDDLVSVADRVWYATVKEG